MKFKTVLLITIGTVLGTIIFHDNSQFAKHDFDFTGGAFIGLLIAYIMDKYDSFAERMWKMNQGR